MLSEDQAIDQVKNAVNVTRVDVARAKSWLLQNHPGGGVTDTLVAEWLRAQSLNEPSKVNYLLETWADESKSIAMAYGARIALYQATWELVQAGVYVSVTTASWWKASLEFDTRSRQWGADVGIEVPYPCRLGLMPLPVSFPVDTDVFLNGLGCSSLSEGIRVGVRQSLECFRRGLYLPSIVMLAASAEATWIECGTGVASKLGNQKLTDLVSNPFDGIGKKVDAIRSSLATHGKDVLKAAKVQMQKLEAAEQWTATLRERRNALHWGKSGNFIADHTEAGTLLLGAPVHLATLEAIRAAC